MQIIKPQNAQNTNSPTGNQNLSTCLVLTVLH